MTNLTPPDNAHSVVTAPATAPVASAPAPAATEKPGGVTMDVVVARYREDPGWLAPLGGYVLLYDKSGDAAGAAALCRGAGLARLAALPNVGRESHTYLHHIVDHYDTLADVTVFVQGDVMDHVPEAYRWRHPAEWLRDLAAQALERGVSGNAAPHLHYGSMCARRELRMATIWPTLKDSGRTLGGWLDWALEPLPDAERAARRVPEGEAIAWYAGACFAARRDHLRQHPRAFWERLLAQVSDHADPEAGHYMERSWHALVRGV